MNQKTRWNPYWLLLPAIIVFAFVYPRILISVLGKENPWTSYLYTYGFGTIYTGLGLILALKTGACNLKRQRDYFWIRVIIGGFAYFATLHALWIVFAVGLPYKGV